MKIFSDNLVSCVIFATSKRIISHAEMTHTKFSSQKLDAINK